MLILRSIEGIEIGCAVRNGRYDFDMPVSLSRETSTGEAGVFKISVVPVVRPDDQAASADFNVFLGWLGYYSDQDSSLQYSERARQCQHHLDSEILRCSDGDFAY